MSSLYQLFCDHCSWKKITEGTDVADLVAVKSSPIPKGSPYQDPVSKEMVIPKAKPAKKKYKCPNCGHIVMPREIKNPQEDVEQKMDIERRIQKRLENDEKERQRQVERQLKKQHWLIGGKASPERREVQGSDSPGTEG